jgi:hypothetical protein
MHPLSWSWSTLRAASGVLGGTWFHAYALLLLMSAGQASRGGSQPSRRHRDRSLPTPGLSSSSMRSGIPGSSPAADT